MVRLWKLPVHASSAVSIHYHRQRRHGVPFYAQGSSIISRWDYRPSYRAGRVPENIAVRGVHGLPRIQVYDTTLHSRKRWIRQTTIVYGTSCPNFFRDERVLRPSHPNLHTAVQVSMNFNRFGFEIHGESLNAYHFNTLKPLQAVFGCYSFVK